VVVLWRYPALIPFVYLLFVAEYVGRFFIGVSSPPIALERPPGAVVNVIFPLLGAVLLALSLRRKTNRG